jgi:hypothetical protein
VADDHGIVGLWSESSVGFVSERDIVERDAGFEGVFGDDGDVLIRDQVDEGVLALIVRLDAL